MQSLLAVKRICDVLFSFILLLLLLPVFGMISILIKLDSRGPVLFTQERAGLYGKPFRIFKFRTMVVDAENAGTGFYTSKNDSRITVVGKFLRDWSLDELPQLFNILKGDMSIIGPRPTLMYQVDEYDEEQRKRLNMKPGVTGWAQVNGRNLLSWPERIKLDIWYVENWTLLLDLKIIFRTFAVIIKREGVYAESDKFVIKNRDRLFNKNDVDM